MKKSFFGFMAIGLLTSALLSSSWGLPAFAADDDEGISVTNTPSSRVIKPKTPAVPLGSTSLGSSAPTASVTTPAAVTVKTAPAPASTSPATPSTPATPASATNAEAASPDSIKSGNLIFGHPHLSTSGDHIDLFFSIKNDGKADERLGGAESTWTSGDIVLVTKKDGKEVEGPVSVIIPTGKSVEFSSGDMWIRVKKADKEPKNPTVFPITFYFRSSPNTTLKISMKGQSAGSSLMNWFEK